ncbi:MAG TPA: hypothetical protein VFD83_00100 [Candidatus Polarisedimenticolia bacterium]|nr:hypothetical protein [Candidatus Polarisedimenticolia bacterium]
MPRRSTIRAGILFAVLPWFVISCGTKTATQPSPDATVVSVPATEEFLTSAQQEHRELLVDGRATPIEWNAAGDPDFVLMQGINGGGDFLLSLRSVWSYDRFGATKGIYFLLQWPDPTFSVLEQPIVNDSIDVFDDAGNQLFDCATDDRVIRPTSWHRATDVHEDQVEIEIFSDAAGSYPADNWRWGAGTTDPVFPTSNVEFVGAVEDTLGSTSHPVAGFLEDRYDVGGGPVDDQGRVTYHDNFHLYSNGIVPDSIVSKGQRDTRLNRGKPAGYTIWGYVAKPLDQCDLNNPIRVDDSSERDKSWNPGDYVPSLIVRFPTLSQLSVIGRATWNSGKWNLEVRRDLVTYDKRLDVNGNNPSLWIPWNDDLPLVPGQKYSMRITIYDASKTRASRSPLLPLTLRSR